MSDIEDFAQAQGSNTMLIAIIAILVLVVLYKLFFSSAQGNAILLVGPCDAGKTTLFFQLRDQTTHNGTVASMEANEAACTLKSDRPSARPVRVVDIPGHPRLRRKFTNYAPEARGIVFVIDSVDFMPKKSEVAEQLFDVITNPVVVKRRVPILLACNKADAGPRAHTVDFIRKRLEKEIDSMRSTRGALGEEQGAQQAAVVATPGEPFTFETFTKLRGVSVTTAAVSALDVGGTRDIETYIRTCIP